MKKIREVAGWLYNLWVQRRLSDKEVWDNYVKAGANFGHVVSYGDLAEYLVGREHFFLDWAKWEKEYSRRGYRTLSVDDFIDYICNLKSLNGLGVKREINEKILLHADTYRKAMIH